MKHLKIEYNGIVLWDEDVEELQWNDGPNGVSVAGKAKRTAAGSQVGGLLEKLVGATKQQTQSVVAEKRSNYVAEEGKHGSQTQRQVQPGARDSQEVTRA